MEAWNAGCEEDLSAPWPCEKHSVKEFEKRVSYSAFGDSYSLLRRAREAKSISPSCGCPAVGGSGPDGWTGGLGGQVAREESRPLPSTVSPKREGCMAWREQGVHRVKKGFSPKPVDLGKLWTEHLEKNDMGRESCQDTASEIQPRFFAASSLSPRKGKIYGSFPDHPLGPGKPPL